MEGPKRHEKKTTCRFSILRCILLASVFSLWNGSIGHQNAWSRELTYRHGDYDQHEHAAAMTTFSVNATTLQKEIDRNHTLLPKWMQEYFIWHAKQRSIINQKKLDWKDQNLLVMRCKKRDLCGGFADRMKALPLLVAVAAKTKRILLIHWKYPFSLEEFLSPGPLLDWTVPVDLKRQLAKAKSKANSKHTSDLVQVRKPTLFSRSRTVVLFSSSHLDNYCYFRQLQLAYESDIWLVESALHSTGEEDYFQLVRELEADQQKNNGPLGNQAVMSPNYFFRSLFYGIFVPSPPVEKLLRQTMDTLGLRPTEYVSAHYRARYPREPYERTKNVTILQETARHAIHCALSTVGSTSDIYLASDTLLTLQTVQQSYFPSKHNNTSKLNSNRVVSFLDTGLLSSNEDPAHLQFSKSNLPSSFYPLFVDLWIMSQSRCVSYGAGGFGQFASWISHNVSCGKLHSKKGRMEHC